MTIRVSIIVQLAIGTIKQLYQQESFTIGILQNDECAEVSISFPSAYILLDICLTIGGFFTASLQELMVTHDRPVINLETHNSKLFAYVHNLNVVQKLRENLEHMRKYLSECRLAAAAKLMDHQIGKIEMLKSKTNLRKEKQYFFRWKTTFNPVTVNV